jgi:hypothetical protein
MDSRQQDMYLHDEIKRREKREFQLQGKNKSKEKEGSKIKKGQFKSSSPSELSQTETAR